MCKQRERKPVLLSEIKRLVINGLGELGRCGGEKKIILKRAGLGRIEIRPLESRGGCGDGRIRGG